MATAIFCEPPPSLPATSRWNGWYQQRSNTSLLDPALGADNGDDDGTLKLMELEKQMPVNCLHKGALHAPLHVLQSLNRFFFFP